LVVALSGSGGSVQGDLRRRVHPQCAVRTFLRGRPPRLLGTDVFKLVALGKVQIGSADPDAFLHAVARELPLVNIATLYQSYPIALVAKSPIDTPEAIRGKRIGISGTYGSSYLGLKAILAEANVSLEDIHLATIGFNQVTALSQDRVDIVVGYINNEPVRLEKQGFSVYVRTLGDQNGIPGVGLMTSVRFLQQKPEVVAGFLRATFRGMHDVITDPAAFSRRPCPSGPRTMGANGVMVSAIRGSGRIWPPFWRTQRTNPSTMFGTIL